MDPFFFFHLRNAVSVTVLPGGTAGVWCGTTRAHTIDKVGDDIAFMLYSAGLLNV